MERKNNRHDKLWMLITVNSGNGGRKEIRRPGVWLSGRIRDGDSPQGEGWVILGVEPSEKD